MAINLFHQKWRVSGEPTSGLVSGTGLHTNSAGYPIGTDGTLNTHADCLAIVKQLVPDANIVAGNACSWQAVCDFDRTSYDYGTNLCGANCDIFNLSTPVVSGISYSYNKYMSGTGALIDYSGTPTCNS